MNFILRLSLFFVIFNFSISALASFKTFYPSQLKTKIDKGEIQNDELQKELFLITQSNKKNKLNYYQARQALFGKLHLRGVKGNHYVKDVYCLKKYGDKSNIGKMQIPDSRHINCEHTWPQSKFNRKMDAKLQKVDLHHLYPSNSMANTARSNHYFAEVEDGQFGKLCSSSKKGKALYTNITAFEPPNQHKGNVARALFYFSTRYNLPIKSMEEDYLRKWHEQDPVDEEEIKRNNEIENIQKNRNPFIDFPHAVYLIENF